MPTNLRLNNDYTPGKQLEKVEEQKGSTSGSRNRSGSQMRNDEESKGSDSRKGSVLQKGKRDSLRGQIKAEKSNVLFNVDALEESSADEVERVDEEDASQRGSFESHSSAMRSMEDRGSDDGIINDSTWQNDFNDLMDDKNFLFSKIK